MFIWYKYGTFNIFVPLNTKNNMATVTKTRINCKNAMHYYRFKIYFGKHTKPEYQMCSDIRFFNRAFNDEQQKHNAESKRIVQLRMDAIKKQLNHGTYRTLNGNFGGETPLLQHWRWVIEKRGANSSDTESNYRSVMLNFVAFMESRGYNPDIKISQLNKNLVMEFKAYLENEATIRQAGKSKLSQNSINTYYIKFCVMLNDAVDQKLIMDSPAKNITVPRRESIESIYLSKQEIEQLKATECSLPFVKKAFLFACYTGLKGGDINNLKWKHLPIIEGNVMLDLITGKNKVRLHFTLPKQALEFLPERLGADDKVFTNFKWDGHNNNLLKIWSLKAGIKGKNVTSHVARHTFAISNLQKGVSLYHVSKLIAHDSIRTTERLYGKFAMEDLDKALAIAFE